MNAAEELSTVLCEIEAMLNSCPPTFVYNELDEGQPLTPTSFFRGGRLTALPVAEREDFASSPEMLREIWKQRKAFFNRLWVTGGQTTRENFDLPLKQKASNRHVWRWAGSSF